jgi:hypothetical protein
MFVRMNDHKLSKMDSKPLLDEESKVKLLKAVEEGKFKPIIKFNIDKTGNYELKTFIKQLIIGSCEWTAAWYMYMQTGRAITLFLPTKYIIGYLVASVLYTKLKQ